MPASLSLPHALAADERVGVEAADHHAGDFGVDELRHARRGLLFGVAARLERDVGGRAEAAAVVVGQILERQRLGVRAAVQSVVALAQDFAAAGDDAADGRVGFDAAAAQDG